MAMLVTTKRIASVLAIPLVVSLAAGCGVDNHDVLSRSKVIDRDATFVRTSLDDTEATDSIAVGTQALGGALLALDSNKNPLLSPWAISRAVGQVRLGASDEAAHQIDTIFGFPKEGRDQALNAIIASLDEHDGPTTGYSVEEPPEVTVFRSTDGFFIDETVKVAPKFLTDSKTVFDTGIYSVDYSSNAETVMNAFLDESSGGLIPKLPTPPAEDTNFSILSTNFFAAPWDTPFDVMDTTIAKFTRADGTTVDAQTMNSSTLDLAYLRGEGFQAVELPYSDGFVMRLVLPEEGVAADSQLSPDSLLAVSEISRTQTHPVLVSLPRWDMRYRSNLTEDLRGIGLESPFQPGNLEGIGASAEVSRIDQETAITVAEHGTVAATAVTVEIEVGAAPLETAAPIRLDFDRPFIYSIVDTKTETTLFMGRLDDPAVSG